MANGSHSAKPGTAAALWLWSSQLFLIRGENGFSLRPGLL